MRDGGLLLKVSFHPFLTLSFPLKTLAGMPSLTSLNLSHNALPTLNSYMFQQLSNSLLSLDLSYNNLTRLTKASFGSALPKLVMLDLSNNPEVTSIDNGLWQSLGSLGALCLAGMPVDCCGLERLRDQGVIDAAPCLGHTVCASPANVAGEWLTKTTGTICKAPTPGSSKQLPEKELEGIAGGVGAFAVLIVLAVLIMLARRNRRTGSYDHEVPETSDEGAPLVVPPGRSAVTNYTNPATTVVFEEA